MKRGFALCWAAPHSGNTLARQQMQALCVLDQVLEDIGAQTLPELGMRAVQFADGSAVRVQLQPEMGAGQITLVVEAETGSDEGRALHNVELMLLMAVGQVRNTLPGVSKEILQVDEHGPFAWKEAPFLPPVLQGAPRDSGPLM